MIFHYILFLDGINPKGRFGCAGAGNPMNRPMPARNQLNVFPEQYLQ